MGEWHIDPQCEAALIRLNDALCMFERSTGRECTLILIPKASDEPIHLSQSGKPLPAGFEISPREMLEMAMREREDL